MRSRPPNAPSFTDAEVHVWRAGFGQITPAVATLEGILSEAERARAQRFHFDQHRRQYMLSHAILRQILGGYLSLDPARLCFQASAKGKPELMPELNPLHLRFNLSHTHGLALIAVTLRRDVGVDVEWFRLVTEAEQIAERFFAPRESARLRALPAEQKQRAFFNCWTRREAYLKATGEGIAESLDQIEVTFAPGEPARLLSVRGDTPEAEHWLLQELSPGPGYVAALAARGQGLKVLQRDWTGDAASPGNQARSAEDG
jgi:4'-phosphopantetheinyl transferase